VCNTERYCENKYVEQGWLDSRALIGRGNTVSPFAVKLEYGSGINVDLISTLFPKLEIFTVKGITAHEVEWSTFTVPLTAYIPLQVRDFGPAKAGVSWADFRRWAWDTDFGGFQGLIHMLGFRKGAERAYDVVFEVRKTDGKVSISVGRTLWVSTDRTQGYSPQP
jgi:hypothetical protein